MPDVCKLFWDTNGSGEKKSAAGKKIERGEGRRENEERCYFAQTNLRLFICRNLCKYVHTFCQ